MDNVLGAGSVLIAPPEGNMTDYLASLERMRDLPGLNFLCGSHGQAVSDASGKISEYIAHRLAREKEVARALQEGAVSPEEVARVVYKDLDPALFPLAVRSAEAHMERIRELSGSSAA
jgi:ribonuclease/clavin/mitogillin